MRNVRVNIAGVSGVCLLALMSAAGASMTGPPAQSGADARRSGANAELLCNRRAAIEHYLRLQLPESCKHLFCYVETCAEGGTLWARLDVPREDLPVLLENGSLPGFASLSSQEQEPESPQPRQGRLYFWEPSPSNSTYASKAGGSPTARWQAHIAAYPLDDSLVRVHIVYRWPGHPDGRLTALASLPIQVPDSALDVQCRMESLDAGWTQGGNSVWVRFELPADAFKDLWEQLVQTPNFRQSPNALDTRSFLEQTGADIPWWRLSGAPGEGAGKDAFYVGSSHVSDNYLDIYASRIDHDTVRTYIYSRRRAFCLEPREAIWRVLRSDVPLSARDVQYWDNNNAMGNLMFAARFDAPEHDLRLFLSGSDRLPAFDQLKNDPRVQESLRLWGTKVGIPWWCPDELPEPLCAQMSHPTDTPVLIESTSVCAGRTDNGLMRLYLRFYAGD